MSMWIAVLLVSGALSTAVTGQEKLPPTYQLRFRLVESGSVGSTPQASHFALIVQSNSRGKINASRRIPYYSSSKGEAKELHTAALGSIIECSPQEAESGVRLKCDFESSFVEPAQAAKPLPAGFLPVVNSRQISTTATLAPGQETQIATLDDPSSGNNLAVYVTADRVSLPGGGR